MGNQTCYSRRHILGHRSGMARRDMSYGGVYGGHMGTLKDVVRSLRYLPMLTEPTETFYYSNIMYIYVQLMLLRQ